MSPDFEYFLRLSPTGGLGRSPLGLVVWCLPASLLVLSVFHAVLKQPLVSLLRAEHQRRLLPLCTPFRFGPTGRFLMIVLSIMIGAVSHLAWDAITHHEGWVAHRVRSWRWR